ncbi:sulfotransferase [Marinomonas sp.]|uniref:tetratricopeptide repeat-containing sulfotransferase family protein n=1 Tax=Marinomonas sp. TaxID=1904862 RepID=UPI003A91C8FE
MDSKLALLREMAEQQEYLALQQACREQLMQSDFRPVQILFALSCAHLNELETAQSILSRVLGTAVSEPLSLPEQQDVSAVYIAMSDYCTAELSLDRLLQQDPSNALNLARKAYCRLMQNDSRGAYQLYTRSIEHDSSKVEIWLNLCLLLLANQSDNSELLCSDVTDSLDLVWSHLAQAEAQFTEFQDIYTAQRRESLIRQLGSVRLECWVLESKFAEAEAWLNACLGESDYYRDNVLFYAECLFLHGKQFVAEAALLNAAKQYPDQAEFYRQLAIFAYEQNRMLDGQYYQTQYDARILNHNERWVFEQGVGVLPVVDFKDSARIRARFNRDFISARFTSIESQDESLNALQPVFIIGVPFSGLSLVEQLLLCSEQVASLGISSHFPVLVEGLNLQHRKKGSNRSYPDSVDTLSLQYLAEMAQGLQSLYDRKAPNASVVIDKCVHNISHIGLIKSVFPNAKIISVRRDPRALALSSRVAHWLKPHLSQSMASDDNESTTVPYLLGQQLVQYNTLLAHWKSLFAESIFELSFEELTSKGNIVASRLFDFLDMPVPKNIEQAVTRVAQYAPDDASIKWSTYKQELSLLLRAMSKKSPAPVNDMVTLPEPNMLSNAYEYYQQAAYQEAEYQCKVLLHHLPDFAPALYLLGEIYLRNDLLAMGVECLNKAIDLAPWKRQQWQQNLTKAVQLLASQESSSKQFPSTHFQCDMEAK